MSEISAIFLKAGSSESLHEIKDALVRSYALSAQDLSFGIGPGGDTIDLSAKGSLVGSVDLSGIGGGTAITLYDEIVGEVVQATELSIMKLTRETYDQISAAGQLLSDCLYIVDCEVPSDLSSFTNSPGYISSVPDSYKTYDDTKASLSTDGYVTEDDLTAFYLKSETSSKGQILEALGEKADISSIPLSTSQLANDSGFIVLSDVNIPTDLSSFTNSPGYLTAVPDAYKTYSDTKGSLSAEGYVISSTLENFYLKSETSSSGQILDALGNKADISSVPLSTSQLTNDSGFLTSHQSLSDYYLKSETSSSAQISDVLSSKADISQIPLSTSQLTNDSGFVISSDIHIPTDLSSFTNSPNYVVSSDLSAYQLSGDYLKNNSSVQNLSLSAGTATLNSLGRLTIHGSPVDIPEATVIIGNLDEGITVEPRSFRAKDEIAGVYLDGVSITYDPELKIESRRSSSPSPADLMTKIKFTGGTYSTPVTSSLADLVYLKSETSSAAQISDAIANIDVSRQLSSKLD